ncbi:MAG: ABC transporter, permease protein 2 (cluster 1, maltose/g3p/polyamine/iron), partial [uncultured Thermomicrobiales bacterium]
GAGGDRSKGGAANRGGGRERAVGAAGRPRPPPPRCRGDALPATLAGQQLDQTGEPDLQRPQPLAAGARPLELPPGLGGRGDPLRPLLPQLVRRRWRRRGRQPGRLLDGRLRLRPDRLQVQAALVRPDAGHHHAARPRDADPAVHPVPELRLGQLVPAPDRAQVPRHRLVLHLPDGPVHPGHPEGARRGRRDRRLRPLRRLLADHPAADDAGPGDHRDLHLHLDLRGFPAAPRLPLGHDQVHGAPGAAALPGLDRRVGLGAADGDVAGLAGAGLRHLLRLPAAADRGHLDHRAEGV